jgi:glutamate dehydrogenase/leucine dehydrogenase
VAVGGCRFAPTVTAEDVTKLAQCMSLKLAPHGSRTSAFRRR